MGVITICLTITNPSLTGFTGVISKLKYCAMLFTWIFPLPTQNRACTFLKTNFPAQLCYFYQLCSYWKQWDLWLSETQAPMSNQQPNPSAGELRASPPPLPQHVSTKAAATRLAPPKFCFSQPTVSNVTLSHKSFAQACFPQNSFRQLPTAEQQNLFNQSKHTTPQT